MNAPINLGELREGDVVDYRGHLHAVANIDCYGVWLISLEHLDAVPFLSEREPDAARFVTADTPT